MPLGFDGSTLTFEGGTIFDWESFDMVIRLSDGLATYGLGIYGFFIFWLLFWLTGGVLFWLTCGLILII